MLLGGALLTACSVEDDLNVALDNQEANPSAPVFTVSVDNGDDFTRAEWLDQFNGDRSLKLVLEDDDKVSLYHGMAQNTLGSDWQHAIYTGEFDEAANKLNFKTQAMVQPGRAILIYPADLAFENGYDYNNSTMQPTIRIPLVQDGKTKEDYTAYMSEVMHIDKPDVVGTSSANGTKPGYAQENTYDIVLRRAAGSLVLNMDVTGKAKINGISGLTYGIDIDSVRLEDNNTFTHSIEVTGTGTDPVKKSTHKSWVSQSTLDQTKTKEFGKIMTKDVEIVYNEAGKEYTTATFTLLPVPQAIAAAKGTDVPVSTAAGAAKVPAFTGTNGSITVKTTYGKVELTTSATDAGNLAGAATAARVWHTGGGQAITTKAGLDYVYNYIWTNTNSTSKEFYVAASGSTPAKTEKVGGVVKATLDVDLNKLNMDGLHIKDQEHLMNALKVYKELYLNVPANATTPVNFILDGEKSGTNKGKFVMNSTTWKEVQKYSIPTTSPAYTPYIHFSPCQDENKCTAIVLEDDGGTLTEVPQLVFDNTSAPFVPADIELVGKWKFTQVTGNPLTSSTVQRKIKGINDLKVVGTSELTLKGYVAIEDIAGEIKVESGASVWIDGEAILQEDMTNFGTITINEGQSLSVSVKEKGTEATAGTPGTPNTIATLVNREAPVKDTNAWKNHDKEGTSGKIINKGSLAIVDVLPGEIHNYGVISMEDGNARTLITANADCITDKENTSDPAPEALKTAFTNEDTKTATKPMHRIGSILLATKTGGPKDLQYTVVRDQKRQGFIKWTVTEADINTNTVGIANYVIAGKGCTGIAQNGTLTSAVKYIEIHKENTSPIVVGKNGSTTATGTLVTLEGLIVPGTTQSVNVPTGSRMQINQEIYLKGIVTKAEEDNFTYRGVTFEGYFSGKATDNERIYTSR